MFKFASLQSMAAARVLNQHDLDHLRQDISTVVFVDSDSQVYTKSTAALKIMSNLAFPWSYIGPTLLWIPRVIRDLGYDFIAKTRYRFWGKASEEGMCEYRPEWRDRFLS